jgi:uncharacterized iron-regulated membrane protein
MLFAGMLLRRTSLSKFLESLLISIFCLNNYPIFESNPMITKTKKSSQKTETDPNADQKFLKKLNTRQTFVLIHRYVGMILGLVVCIIALTGTLLSFNHEIDHAINPALMTVTPQAQTLSVDTLLETAQKTHPDYKLAYFEPPQQPQDSYMIELIKEISEEEETSFQVFVDPYTGKVLGERKGDAYLMGFVYALHYELASGKWGSRIVSITALAWIVIGVSGLLIWPSWKRLKQGFRVRTSRWLFANYDYHKVVGIIAAGFILVLGVSGSIFQFHEQVEPVVAAVTRSPEAPELKSVPPSKGATRLSYAEIFQRAEKAVPNAVSTWVSYPAEPDEAIEVDRKQPGDMNQWGKHWVVIDQYSGEVLGITTHDTTGATPLDTFNNWNWNIHTSIWGGIPTRILLSIFGLTPAILFITGLVIFWGKTRRVKRV